MGTSEILTSRCLFTTTTWKQLWDNLKITARPKETWGLLLAKRPFAEMFCGHLMTIFFLLFSCLWKLDVWCDLVTDWSLIFKSWQRPSSRVANATCDLYDSWSELVMRRLYLTNKKTKTKTWQRESDTAQCPRFWVKCSSRKKSPVVTKGGQYAAADTTRSIQKSAFSNYWNIIFSIPFHTTTYAALVIH